MVEQVGMRLCESLRICVERGDSWNKKGKNCRWASGKNNPSNTNYNIGFRLASS